MGRQDGTDLILVFAALQHDEFDHERGDRHQAERRDQLNQRVLKREPRNRACHHSEADTSGVVRKTKRNERATQFATVRRVDSVTGRETSEKRDLRRNTKQKHTRLQEDEFEPVSVVHPAVRVVDHSRLQRLVLSVHHFVHLLSGQGARHVVRREIES